MKRRQHVVVHSFFIIQIITKGHDHKVTLATNRGGSVNTNSGCATGPSRHKYICPSRTTMDYLCTSWPLLNTIYITLIYKNGYNRSPFVYFYAIYSFSPAWNCAVPVIFKNRAWEWSSVWTRHAMGTCYALCELDQHHSTSHTKFLGKHMKQCWSCHSLNREHDHLN